MPNPLSTAITEGPLVVALAYDGLAVFEFGIVVEVFGLPRPEMGPGWYRFAVASVRPGPVWARGGVRLHADGGLDLLATASGGGGPGGPAAGGGRGPHPGGAALRAAPAGGPTLAAICGGAFVLAQAGLLKGRGATTHLLFNERFAAAHPGVRLVPDVLYVDEGQVLTSAGSAAGIDLCLHIVRRDFGPTVANRVARRLVMPPHRDGGQAQFTERPVPPQREGTRLSPLLDRMRERLAEDQPLAMLAAEAGMSVRTFLRRFEAATGMTPAAWLLSERLARARELLEGSGSSLDDIAVACGFGSVVTFRNQFRAKLGTSPSAYRKQFSAPALPGGPASMLPDCTGAAI